jgi:transcriptional regulator with XRE-family HTH domain
MVIDMDNEYKIGVGQRLHYLRKLRRLPVQTITDRLGIARSTYTGWENGHRTPKGDSLVQLADLFGTTVDFITGNTEDESQPKIDLEEIIGSQKYIFGGKEISAEKKETLETIIKALLKD